PCARTSTASAKACWWKWPISHCSVFSVLIRRNKMKKLDGAIAAQKHYELDLCSGAAATFGGPKPQDEELVLKAFRMLKALITARESGNEERVGQAKRAVLVEEQLLIGRGTTIHPEMKDGWNKIIDEFKAGMLIATSAELDTRDSALLSIKR